MAEKRRGTESKKKGVVIFTKNLSKFYEKLISNLYNGKAATTDSIC